MIVGLVSCCSTKATKKVAASAMYTSPLFRMSVEFIKPLVDEWWILSAAHHLLDPREVIAPYERTLPTRKKEAELWGLITAGSLLHRYGVDDEFIFMAGEDYVRPVVTRLKTFQGHHDDGWRGVPAKHIHEPMRGKMIGQRLSWLRARLDARGIAGGEANVIGARRRFEFGIVRDITMARLDDIEARRKATS